jgi:hypothetical protein
VETAGTQPKYAKRGCRLSSRLGRGIQVSGVQGRVGEVGWLLRLAGNSQYRRAPAGCRAATRHPKALGQGSGTITGTTKGRETRDLARFDASRRVFKFLISIPAHRRDPSGGQRCVMSKEASVAITCTWSAAIRNSTWPASTRCILRPPSLAAGIWYANGAAWAAPEPCASAPSRHWRNPNTPSKTSKNKSVSEDTYKRHRRKYALWAFPLNRRDTSCYITRTRVSPLPAALFYPHCRAATDPPRAPHARRQR